MSGKPQLRGLYASQVMRHSVFWFLVPTAVCTYYAMFHMLPRRKAYREFRKTAEDLDHQKAVFKRIYEAGLFKSVDRQGNVCIDKFK